jgi:hypothetical protein
MYNLYPVTGMNPGAAAVHTTYSEVSVDYVTLTVGALGYEGR